MMPKHTGAVLQQPLASSAGLTQLPSSVSSSRSSSGMSGWQRRKLGKAKQSERIRTLRDILQQRDAQIAVMKHIIATQQAELEELDQLVPKLVPQQSAVIFDLFDGVGSAAVAVQTDIALDLSAPDLFCRMDATGRLAPILSAPNVAHDEQADADAAAADVLVTDSGDVAAGVSVAPRPFDASGMHGLKVKDFNSQTLANTAELLAETQSEPLATIDFGLADNGCADHSLDSASEQHEAPGSSNPGTQASTAFNYNDYKNSVSTCDAPELGYGVSQQLHPEALAKHVDHIEDLTFICGVGKHAASTASQSGSLPHTDHVGTEAVATGDLDDPTIPGGVSKPTVSTVSQFGPLPHIDGSSQRSASSVPADANKDDAPRCGHLSSDFNSQRIALQCGPVSESTLCSPVLESVNDSNSQDLAICAPMPTPAGTSQNYSQEGMLQVAAAEYVSKLEKCLCFLEAQARDAAAAHDSNVDVYTGIIATCRKELEKARSRLNDSNSGGRS